jgi:hypothetical protein
MGAWWAWRRFKAELQDPAGPPLTRARARAALLSLETLRRGDWWLENPDWAMCHRYLSHGLVPPDVAGAVTTLRHLRGGPVALLHTEDTLQVVVNGCVRATVLKARCRGFRECRAVGRECEAVLGPALWALVAPYIFVIGGVPGFDWEICPRSYALYSLWLLTSPRAVAQLDFMTAVAAARRATPPCSIAPAVVALAAVGAHQVQLGDPLALLHHISPLDFLADRLLHPMVPCPRDVVLVALLTTGEEDVFMEWPVRPTVHDAVLTLMDGSAHYVLDHGPQTWPGPRAAWATPATLATQNCLGPGCQ